jgi:hypothetical protein
MTTLGQNSNYSIVSPVGASPALPGGAAGYQAGLNQLQNAFPQQYPVLSPQGAFPAQATPNFASQPFSPTAVYSPGGNSYTSSTPGNPVWNGQSWVSSSTGAPYSGSYFGTNYVNGQTYQQVANNPNEAYTPVNITKSPPIASATTGLLNSFGQGLNLQNNNFSDYLNEANNATGAATAGFNNDINGAYNLAPLTGTLNNLNSQYAGGVNSLNTGFANTSDALNSQYSNTLSNLAGQENQDVSQAYGLLPQYNTAIQNIGEQEKAALEQQVDRNAAASGTPTGLGSNEEQTLALGIGDEQVPLQEAEIGQQYNVLENLALPVQQQEAQAQVGQLQNFTLPLAQTQYGQGLNALNTTYGQQAGTAQTLQNLSIAIAGKPIAEAVQYMQSLGVPTEIQQQLLGGNVSNLSGLNSLYSGSNYQGLQNNLGANVATPTGSSFRSPGYPNLNSSMGLPTFNYGTGSTSGVNSGYGGGSAYTPGYAPPSPTVGYGSQVGDAAGSLGLSPSDYAGIAAQYGISPDDLTAAIGSGYVDPADLGIY